MARKTARKCLKGVTGMLQVSSLRKTHANGLGSLAIASRAIGTTKGTVGVAKLILGAKMGK